MAEQNKALVARFIDEIFNKGNMQAADELLSADFVEHEHLPAGIPRDREGVKVLAGMLRSAFPDLKATVEDSIAEGDKVVIRMTWSGTHKRRVHGRPGERQARIDRRDRYHPCFRGQGGGALGSDGWHVDDAADWRPAGAG